jgi:hypothetical protein
VPVLSRQASAMTRKGIERRFQLNITPSLRTILTEAPPPSVHDCTHVKTKLVRSRSKAYRPSHSSFKAIQRRRYFQISTIVNFDRSLTTLRDEAFNLSMLQSPLPPEQVHPLAPQPQALALPTAASSYGQSPTPTATAPLSPSFLVDQAHLKLPPEHARSVTHSFCATYLHTPVRLTPLPTPVLHARASVLSSLRHPNLEFLLGTASLSNASPAVAPLTCRSKTTEYAVTDAAAAVPFASLPSPISLCAALRCALDVARACVYFHCKTNIPHGNVRAEAVFVDLCRRRAVLSMLAIPRSTDEMEPASFANDVRALLRMLAGSLGAGDLSAGGRRVPLDVIDGGPAGLYAAVDVAINGCVYDARLPSMEDCAVMLRKAADRAGQWDGKL